MGGQSKQKRKILNKMDSKLDQLIASLQEMTAKAAESEPEAPPAVYHPPHSDIGFFGYTCLLVGAICMAVSTLYFYMKAMNAKPGARKFEVITMLVTGIATVLYMTMFSGAGYGYVKELGHDINPHDAVDQFFYGRYIDWLLTTPLMIWDVLNIAGPSTDDILMAVGVDVLMIAFGAVGAQTPSAQKWLFFICGMVFLPHRWSSPPIHQSQHLWRSGSSPLLPCCIPHNCPLVSLPTRLDCRRRSTTCLSFP